jgi:hypothetical protein
LRASGILVLAAPVTQPLRFAAPPLDETQPQRLDDVDMITVDHDAPAQFVQFLRVAVDQPVGTCRRALR